MGASVEREPKPRRLLKCVHATRGNLVQTSSVAFEEHVERDTRPVPFMQVTKERERGLLEQVQGRIVGKPNQAVEGIIDAEMDEASWRQRLVHETPPRPRWAEGRP